MNLVLWIILGAFSGLIMPTLMKNNEGRLVVDVVFGILGALVGGMLMNLIGAAGVTELNIYSLIVAILGSLVLVGLRKAFV